MGQLITVRHRRPQPSLLWADWPAQSVSQLWGQRARPWPVRVLPQTASHRRLSPRAYPPQRERGWAALTFPAVGASVGSPPRFPEPAAVLLVTGMPSPHHSLSPPPCPAFVCDLPSLATALTWGFGPCGSRADAGAPGLGADAPPCRLLSEQCAFLSFSSEGRMPGSFQPSREL